MESTDSAAATAAEAQPTSAAPAPAASGGSGARQTFWKVALVVAMLVAAFQVFSIVKRLQNIGTTPGKGGKQSAWNPWDKGDKSPTSNATPKELFFPDLALGLICSDDKKEVQVTKEQARELLPIIQALSENLVVLHEKEELASFVLEDDQAQYIRDHLNEISNVVLGTRHKKGADPIVDFGLRHLRARIEGKPKEKVPKAPDQRSRNFTLNYMDICFGVVALDKQKPPLPLKEVQIRQLVPLLDEVGRLSYKVRKSEKLMRDIVREDQVTYIKQNLNAFNDRLQSLPPGDEGEDVVTANLLKLLKKRSRDAGGKAQANTETKPEAADDDTPAAADHGKKPADAKGAKKSDAPEKKTDGKK